ncbi:MAG TPA: helix-turn-helix transcriptional regulator [Thermoanaerobaculia bacterium]|jgi:transcriptional regulator with XRE-family HTH domain|nr:helix-turn-helix transcriptional regulator [Thermoanaerobaculia bacterium]
MKVSDFQSKIAEWRLAENLSQQQLDRECGFARGTIARIEQGKLEMKNDQFLRILERTGRDLLATLLEDCGTLFSELLPLSQEIAQSSGTGSAAQSVWHDRELETGLTDLLSGARVVLSKVVKASDQRLWASELLLRAASQASSTPVRQRAGKRGKPRSEA